MEQRPRRVHGSFIDENKAFKEKETHFRNILLALFSSLCIKSKKRIKSILMSLRCMWQDFQEVFKNCRNWETKWKVIWHCCVSLFIARLCRLIFHNFLCFDNVPNAVNSELCEAFNWTHMCGVYSFLIWFMPPFSAVRRKTREFTITENLVSLMVLNTTEHVH